MFAYLHNVWTTPDSNIAVLFSIKSEILPDSFQTVRIQLFNPLGDPLLEENGIGLFSLPRQWDHYLLTIPTNNKLLGLSRSAQGNDRYNYVFEISMDGQVIRFPDEIHLGGYDINLSVDNLYNVIVDSMNIVYPSYYGREHILNKFNYTDDSTIWQITLTDSTYIPIRPGKPKGFYDNVNDKYLYIHRDTVEDFDYLLLDIITSGGISEVDNIQIAADQNIGDYFIQSHFCGFFVAYRVHDDDNGILLYVDSFNLLGENLWENRILLSSNSEEIEYLSVDNDDNLLVIISLIDGLYAKTISIDGNLGVTPNKVYTAKNSISTISPVKIYPSPWNNSFTVISDQSIKYVLIYNLLGKELFRVNSGDLLRSKLQITPTQDLPSGVYFLQINHGKSESLFRTVHLR
ncbi:T9SS type A sorting domain-containing protein [bacterium]|nr:T9SS type A sorting domain-containing protein [bacterium]